MTYSQLISNATVEERREVTARIEKIIGTKKQAMEAAESLTERIENASRWEKEYEKLAKIFVFFFPAACEYEKLAKIFLENGAEALAMVFMQKGNSFEGVTANGKKWFLERNNGWTQRSRYCGTLYIQDVGTVFTSGRLDKVFEYILTN
jgi:lysyl-tRNA synthetase class I